jgi:hypothetical protein
MITLTKTILTSALLIALAAWPAAYAQTPPTRIDIANAPIPIQILVQSPAETATDLQVIYQAGFRAGLG